jgi:hypothetical protein
MGSSVQFRGVKTVIKAFENFDADTWAIFQAKNLLFKGSGSDLLEEILKQMEPFGSDAIYQLKVYEEIDDPKRIKERTEADGSFSFKLGDGDGSLGGSSSMYVRSLEERIKKMEKERDDEDEEDKTIGGRIGNALIGLLEQPNELVQLIGTLKNMLQPVPQGVAAIGKVTADFAPPVYSQPVAPPVPYIQEENTMAKRERKNEEKQPETEQPQKENVNDLSDNDKILRLSAAITTLEKNDAEILLHLEKLAKISEENPQMFKMLIFNLDNF